MDSSSIDNNLFCSLAADEEHCFKNTIKVLARIELDVECLGWVSVVLALEVKIL